MSEIPFSAHWLASMTLEEQWAAIRAMSHKQLKKFRQEWNWWSQDEQKPPPGDWRVWLYLAGRGAGKTRSGAEWVRAQVETGRKRIALVAPRRQPMRATENRRKLLGDLERCDALLRLTTDHQAITAIEQLILETRDRLNELDRADDRSGVGRAFSLRQAPPCRGSR